MLYSTLGVHGESVCWLRGWVGVVMTCTQSQRVVTNCWWGHDCVPVHREMYVQSCVLVQYNDVHASCNKSLVLPFCGRYSLFTCVFCSAQNYRQLPWITGWRKHWCVLAWTRGRASGLEQVYVKDLCIYVYSVFMYSSCALTVGRPDYAHSVYVCETCFLFLPKLVRVFLNLFDWCQGSIVCLWPCGQVSCLIHTLRNWQRLTKICLIN